MHQRWGSEGFFCEADIPYCLDYVKQLGSLPKLPFVEDSLVLSWTTWGSVNEAGQLLYAIDAMSKATGQFRCARVCSGAPAVSDAEDVLFGAMLRPMPRTGPSARPTVVLFAHRWGPEIFERLRPFLWEHGVEAQLESREEAERSVWRHPLLEADADGNNFCST